MVRPMQGLLWETSLLDADEGIRFRGYSIPELQVRRHPPDPCVAFARIPNSWQWVCQPEWMLTEPALAGRDPSWSCPRTRLHNCLKEGVRCPCMLQL